MKTFRNYSDEGATTHILFYFCSGKKTGIQIIEVCLRLFFWFYIIIHYTNPGWKMQGAV
jgi:hypothetical protein